MDNNNFSIQDAKQIDFVNYLEKLGYERRKIRNRAYGYLSPLRDEKTPSFKVNRNINCWFDFGLGEGGTIIDFGIKYFNCGIKEFLDKLKYSEENINMPSLSFQRNLLKSRTENDDQGKIKIVDVRSLKSPELISYFGSRFIDLEIAKKYCQEVDFKLHNRCHKAIGFKNDRGRFELRNAFFKGSSSPKFITLFSSENNKKAWSFLKASSISFPFKRSYLKI